MKLGAVVLGVLGLVRASSAHADNYEFSRVALLDSGCAVVGLGAADLRAAIASELAASALALAPTDQATASTDVVVNLRKPCGADEALVLMATWRENSFERTVKVAELPRASRARALALILAELLARFAKPEVLGADAAAADAVVTAGPSDTPEPETVELIETEPSPSANQAAKPKPAPAATKRTKASATTRAVGLVESSHLAGALELRSFLGGPSLFGGRVQLEFGWLRVGLSAVGGEHTVTDGVLSAFILHGTGAVRAVELDTSARTSLSLGPRIGLGYVVVSASTMSPNVATIKDSEPYVDGAAFAAFAFRPSASARFGATAELGYARGVVALADTADVGHYGGLFASGLLDLAFEL